MTCQWCTYHRRRGGTSICVLPGGDGRVRDQRDRLPPCDSFIPRQSCTTCDRRCSDDEKDERILSPQGCMDWTLRKLTTWGGTRTFRRHE